MATGTTPTACPTSSAWRTASRRRRTIRTAATAARSGSSAGRPTNPLFDGLLRGRPAGRLPLTDDVNGYRQEGFAPFDRNIHRGRRIVGGAGLPPSGDAAGRTSRSGPGAFVTRVAVRGPARGRASSTTGHVAGRADPWRARSSSPAGRSTRRSSCSSPASATRPTSRRSASPVVADLPGVGREPPGPPRGLRPVRAARSRSRCSPRSSCGVGRGSASSGCSSAAAPARRTTSRAAGSSAATTTSRIPNLMFHFLPLADPLRRQRRRRSGTATRSTSARCIRMRAARSRSRSTDPHVHPALRFNYLSTDQDRREWVEAIHVARDILGQPAFDALQRRRDLTRPERRDRRGDPRLGRARRRDGAPPVVHRADGHRRDGRSSTRPRCASTASRACASWMPRSSRTSPMPTSTRR